MGIERVYCGNLNATLITVSFTDSCKVVMLQHLDNRGMLEEPGTMSGEDRHLVPAAQDHDSISPAVTVVGSHTDSRRRLVG